MRDVAGQAGVSLQTVSNYVIVRFARRLRAAAFGQ